jgi:hypothetical protein
VECGVERAFLDEEAAAGAFFDQPREPVPVFRLPRCGLEDEHVERAGEERKWL